MRLRHAVRSLPLLLTLFAGRAAAEAPLTAGDSQLFASPTLGMTVVSGQLALPRSRWEAVAVSPAGAVDQVQISPMLRPAAEQEGERSRRQQAEMSLEGGRQALMRLFGVWGSFASRGGGKPTSLAAAVEDLRKNRPQEYGHTLQQIIEHSPYPGADAIVGPFYFFPPDVPFIERPVRAQSVAAQPLALELRPWLDDGRHWVLDNNGRTERRDIDRALLAAHGVEVRPILVGVRDPSGTEEQPRYVLRGILRDAAAKEVRVTLQDAASGATREVLWNLAGAKPGDAALLAAWARDRAQAWRLLGDSGGSPVLRSWIASAEKLYGSVPPEPGAREAPAEFEEQRRGDFDRSTNAFDILGGRAALEETLQMQLLGTGPRPPDDLIAWWGFEKCNGDNSARGWRSAIAVGTPACVTGVQGKALEFAGGAYLKVEDVSISANGLTIAGWVRLAANVGQTEARIIGMEQPPVKGREERQKSWGLGVFGAGYRGAGANNLALHWADEKNDGVCVATGTALIPGRWHHVAVTAASGTLVLYVDGDAAQSCVAEHFPFWQNPPLTIGRGVDDSPEPFALEGALDELKMFRRALESAEVKELFSPRTAPIPIAEIAGVEVKSHPFAELLGAKEGVRLPLADAVPADRFLLWFAKPSAVFPFLEEGADFLFRAGSLATKSWVDDDLKGRYLRRLGLGEKLGRTFLESGEVTELALVAPDLFFVDGTDLTVLMRVRHPDKVGARIKDLGIVALPAEGLVEKKLDSGRSAWWGRRGDLLLAGTSRAELQASLDLLARDGAGSLGRSAELRYMLSRQEPGAKTRAVAYFSDGFVRRLTGPAVKIGQLRRMRDRAQAVRVTAGALLYRLDRGREERDLARLEALGYTPQGLAAQGWRLREDLAAVSPAWGTLAESDTLGAHPVEAATPEEAKLYKLYVDQYARYWRQYFDPIAVRLDDEAGGDLSLAVFILPLLDSQLYGEARGTIAGAADTKPLRVPRFEPQPVLQLSLNVREGAWQRWTGSLGTMLSQYAGISPRLFDLLGPGVHFAIQDADPILALGNGDTLGAFGSLGVGRGAGGAGLGIPALLSVLTRPCTFAIELKDPAAALAVLRRAVVNAREGRRREMQAEFRQIGDRDAWVLTLNVAGFVRLRLGLEVRQGYLIVNNLPWTPPLAVTAVETAPLRGAALRVAPGSVRLGLSALFATQQEQNQAAALKGIAALQPLLAVGVGDPAAATRRHAALFGAMPLHPSPGEWVWRDGRLASSTYGDASRWRQPPWKEGVGDFGILEGVKDLSVGMQFEDTGLRTLITWKNTK